MPEKTPNSPTHVVLDFDGTCTQVPVVYEQYLELYRTELGRVLEVSPAKWKDAQQVVRDRSPRAGWMVAGCPAAPAAADPYILADESAKYLARQRSVALPPDLNGHPYAAAPAPWRKEARETLSRLVDLGVTVAFVSNSSTKIIGARLDELFDGDTERRSRVAVFSDAGKFRICELPWDMPPSSLAQARFDALPAAEGAQPPAETGRPIYLRRGQYFQAIDRVLAGSWERLSTTVFCGDIWEMDLAMPAALGACVHLLTRAKPFDTYAYERQAFTAVGPRGKMSETLAGLLDWFGPASKEASLIRGGNASVYVSDMDRAVRFYSESLGLRLRTRIGNEWAEIDAGDGMVIGLHPAQPPATVKPATPGAINVELRVVGSLDDVVLTLKERGVPFQGSIAEYENVRLATFTDPDGNAILLAQQTTA